LQSPETDSKFESWLGKQVRVQGSLSKTYVLENCQFGFHLGMLFWRSPVECRKDTLFVAKTIQRNILSSLCNLPSSESYLPLCRSMRPKYLAMCLCKLGERLKELWLDGIVNHSGQSAMPNPTAHVFSRLFQRYTLDSTINFDVQTQKDLFPCRADAMQLEQVLINLCLNARDALTNAYGSIWINTCNTTHPNLGDRVLVSVEDNGIGMSQETQEKIFEPFFTTKEVGSGTGLGLSMAIGVIEQLGGKIECRSKLGLGTRFEVFLPRCKNAMQLPSIQSNGVTSTLTEFQPLSILLVDDDATLRECGNLLLSALGHHVPCAENGVEALKILASDASIHTVLLDLTMPIMSGTEALAIIRTDFPKVRVVICSGYSVEAATLTTNILLQPDGILAKPYQVSDLQRVLTQSVLR